MDDLTRRVDTERERQDDVDRALARLAPLPAPHDFTANVMLAVQAYQPSRAQAYWALAELAAVVVLAVLAFGTGQALVGGGTLDLLRAVFSDAEVLSLLPGATLLAILDSVPWIELAGIAMMLWAVVYCTRGLGRSLVPSASARATRATGAASN